MSNAEYVWGTGRRKTSVARVRMKEGKGEIVVNGRPVDQFFPSINHKEQIMAPLLATNTNDKYDIVANVNGGGTNGQAGAVLLGISRALLKLIPNVQEKLRSGGYLTRDSRMKERKKYGKRKARASYQFSKR